MSALSADDVVQLALGGMKNFVYLFACPETGAAAVVDPAWDVDRILAEAESRGWKIETVLLTHTHGDHTNGVEEVCRRCDASVHVHALEKDRAAAGPAPIHTLKDGATLTLGHLEVEAMHTPGHSPGALCYRAGECLFTGDTLFVGRTGRMVFPGGSQEQMYESTLRLRNLPPGLTVFPGHGYGDHSRSTIGRECKENAFLGCDSLEAFRKVADDWERENG
jgi:hydroxyacylglutathione hydrolase